LRAEHAVMGELFCPRQDGSSAESTPANRLELQRLKARFWEKRKEKKKKKKGEAQNTTEKRGRKRKKTGDS